MNNTCTQLSILKVALFATAVVRSSDVCTNGINMTFITSLYALIDVFVIIKTNRNKQLKKLLTLTL